MYSYKLNNSYTVYVNYAYLNECIKASKPYNSKSNAKAKETSSLYATTTVVKNTVKIGSKVCIMNLATQKRDVVTITYTEDANITKGFISDVSPIGCSLLGHGIGDTVKVNAPSGVIRYKIIDLRS